MKPRAQVNTPVLLNALPNTKDKGVRLDLVALTLELDVTDLSVYCKGRVKTHGLKVKTYFKRRCC